MIIFDLDGTLADCEHRRHFVDIHHALKNGFIPACETFGSKITDEHRGNVYHPITHEKWKPDWKSFYEACDQDKTIKQTINIFNNIYHASSNQGEDIHIWSGRCESVRSKTEKWLWQHAPYCSWMELKMRPLGDSTPDDVLKERWLDEAIAQGKTIDFVFDDRPKVIRMWRRRGIFVFNCCQHDEEF